MSTPTGLTRCLTASSQTFAGGQFLIADGVLPSNEGRGYVLRRIVRRAMRHVHILGVKDPIMALVPALTEQMGQAFPELTRAESSHRDVEVGGKPLQGDLGPRPAHSRR